MGVYDDIKTGLEQAIAYESNALLTGNVDWKDIKGLNVKNMENKCRYYRTRQSVSYTYHPITGEPIAHDVDVGVCNGTRETDECYCCGDETKCTFYPEVRENARKRKFGKRK